MKLLTTTKIDLESIFNFDQIIPHKYFSKGKVKVKSVPINSIDKSYITDCQIIIDAILTHQRNIKDYNRFINLHSKSLNKIMGDKRRLSALHLLEHGLGIIEVNHKYKFVKGSVTNYTKSYIISSNYMGGVRYIDVLTKGGVCYNLQLNGNNHHNVLTKGECAISNNNPLLIPHNTPPFITYQQMQVDWLKINKITGRVFTSVNTMPKVQRSELKDKEGNALIEIDFSTSHLQHLIKLIRDDIQSGKYTPPSGLIEEVVKFKEALLTNDFYQIIADQFNIENGTNNTRDQVKGNIMYWLTGSYNNRKIIKHLTSNYPCITHYIACNNMKYSIGSKTVFGKRLPKRNGMVIRLMQSESYLVNDLIINDFSLKHPDAMCYTIFDGILVEQQYNQSLLDTIKEKGKYYLNFEPKIKEQSCIEVVTKLSLGEIRSADLKVMRAVSIQGGSDKNVTTYENEIDITTMSTTVDDTESYFNLVNENLNKKSIVKKSTTTK